MLVALHKFRQARLEALTQCGEAFTIVEVFDKS
jgi:hypothetical protein